MIMFKFILKKLNYSGKLLLVILIFFSLLSGILSIFYPLIYGNFIDDLLTNKNVSIIKKYCFLLLFLWFFTTTINYFLEIFQIKIISKLSYKVFIEIIEYYRLNESSLEKGKSYAYLSQRINVDVNKIIGFVFSTLSEVIIKISSLFIISLILYKINKKILIFSIIIIIIYILLYFLFKQKLYDKSLEMKESNNLLFGGFTDRLAKSKFISRHNLIKYFDINLNKLFNNFLKKKLNYQKISYLYNSLYALVILIGQISIYYFGGLALIRDEITIGFFTIIISYVNKLFNHANYFLNLGKSYQDAKSSYSRIKKIMNKEIIHKIGLKISNIKSIKLIKVKFNFAEKDLIDISTSFIKNNIYYIKGQNGTGKSTLCDLILGFYKENFKGEILINNIKIQDLDINYLRSHIISISEQNPILVRRNIYDNLYLYIDSAGKNRTSYKEKLDFLVNYFEFDKFIEDNNNRELNEENMSISGGEKQKISIIRTLLLDSQIMIFDEPTSFLDSKSKIKFIELIKKIKQNKIILIISHDQYFEKNVTNIINLDQ